MTEEDKRMYDDHKEHGEDMSYENEGGTVTIPLKEYDKMRSRQSYITDKSLISLIKLKRGENMKHLISAMLVTLFASTSFAADITVEMLNKRKSDNQTMVYSEDISRIDVGDTITWVPTTKGHNVHFLAGPDGWDIPKKSKFNKEVSITFDTPGIYYYQCTPHKSMGMIALVVVGGDTSNKEAIAKIRAMGKSKKKLKALLEEL